MLDSDLDELYGIETKTLKQAVRRNINRFPEDFMFELTKKEQEVLRSQIVTLERGKYSKYLSFAFTEHGVLMLSSVLNSQRAVQINIQVVRLFTRLRQFVSGHNELKLEIEEIKKKLSNHDKNIEVVFSYLDELVEKKDIPRSRKRIGYMPDEL